MKSRRAPRRRRAGSSCARRGRSWQAASPAPARRPGCARTRGRRRSAAGPPARRTARGAPLGPGARLVHRRLHGLEAPRHKLLHRLLRLAQPADDALGHVVLLARAAAADGRGRGRGAAAAAAAVARVPRVQRRLRRRQPARRPRGARPRPARRTPPLRAPDWSEPERARECTGARRLRPERRPRAALVELPGTGTRGRSPQRRTGTACAPGPGTAQPRRGRRTWAWAAPASRTACARPAARLSPARAARWPSRPRRRCPPRTASQTRCSAPAAPAARSARRGALGASLRDGPLSTQIARADAPCRHSASARTPCT